MAKIKRRLTLQQEFEIMKLVFDKFLWLGFGLLAYGFYRLLSENSTAGVKIMAVGIVVLGLFVYILLKEFEFDRS